MQRQALTTIATASLTMTIATTAPASTNCTDRTCDERVAARQCSQDRVIPCIRRAAIRYRQSFSMLLRKAHCESTYNPTAYFPRLNAETAAERRAVDARKGAADTSAGLLAFKLATWRSTPYAKHSRWLAKWSALGAAWAHAVGRGGEWSCA